MDKDFLLLKLGRAVWVSLIEDKKPEDALRYYVGYIDNLKQCSRDKKYKQLALDEISYSEKLFNDKMLKLANDSLDQKNYFNAVYCYGVYFRFKHDDVTVLKNYIKALTEIGQSDLAIDVLNHIGTVDCANDAQLCKLFAEAYAKGNDPKMAVSYLRKYFAILENNVTAEDYNLLGCYYHNLYEYNHDMLNADASMKALMLHII